jgi:NADH-quinone oxidoreductase subunit L
MNFEIGLTLTLAGPLAGLLLILGVNFILRQTERFRLIPFLALGALGLSLVGTVSNFVVLSNQADLNKTFLAILPGLPGLPFRLTIEPFSALISLVVAVVSSFVLIYATGYMQPEEQPRFFAQMLFFIGAMQILVLAGDWILFLIAWELIGLASYLLIGFWYERPGVATAAARAFLTTRTADFGLYVGIFILINQSGTSEITRSVNQLQANAGFPATIAGLLLLGGAMGKSAQLPLQGWLQDAMAGPTPVSALLHSATLVAAGVILLVRSFPLLSVNEGLLLTVGVIGGLTTVATGLMAVGQTDLKRLLASSTSSQLGLMFLALGAGSVGAAVAHLVTHAAMKSTLFLAAGRFQHTYHSTSLVTLAGTGRRQPLTFGIFVIAGLALAGVPPLAGFWSKDAILAATLHSVQPWLFTGFTLLGTLLTGVYIARVLGLLWQKPASTENGYAVEKISASRRTERWMLVGLTGLAILATGLGLGVKPIGQLLNQEIPEDFVGIGLGLLAAGTGLAIGWLLPLERLPAFFKTIADRGFRLAGGWDRLLIRPLMLLAKAVGAVDTKLHSFILKSGRVVVAVARRLGQLDNRLHRGVIAVGRFNLWLANLSRRTDENGIDRFIGLLVNGFRRLGQNARRLQSGLVHRELLLTTGAVALLVVGLVLANLF